MATTCLNNQKFEPAVEFMRQGLTQFRKHHGNDANEDCLSVMVALGDVQLQQGDIPAASQCLSAAVSQLQNMDPDSLPSHSELLTQAYTSLATVGLFSQDFDQAIQCHNLALRLNLDRLGTEMNAKVAEQHQMLGRLYVWTKDFAASFTHLQKAATIYTHIFGTKSTETMSAIRDMGVLHQAQGDTPNAIANLRMAAAIAADTLDPHDDARVSVETMLSISEKVTSEATGLSSSVWLAATAMSLAATVTAAVLYWRSR